MAELHEKYAPILRFARDERFFPMRVDDMLAYSSLYVKGQPKPLLGPGQVTPDRLVKQGEASELFIRSVETGPLVGGEVVAGWSQRAIRLVYDLSQQAASSWTEELARRAYSWFSPTTKTATQLFWWNNLLPSLLQPKAGSDVAEELPRFILPSETRKAAIERYETSCAGQPAYTYYYRQVNDGPYLCLQYWFFYGFNDWAGGFNGLNDHEGDWEGLMLFFRRNGSNQPQEPPAYVTFADHNSRMTKAWAEPEVERIGTHPVGYVAAGSHATYLQPKLYPLLELYDLVDHAAGDGLTLDHSQWVHRIPLDEVAWLNAYRGSWGTRYWLSLAGVKSLLSLATAVTPLGLAGAAIQREIDLPGVSAPRSPMLGETGAPRPQWASPVAWAGVPLPEAG